jgi:N-carbamoyl-L-amino-acid hydrolase
MPPLPVIPSRMIADLQHLRSFGASGNGVARIAFSDADIAARAWLAHRMQDAGLRVVVDACGNLFGLPPGDAPCLLVGSHSDTQPLGGWLDGAYGVVMGLELARAALESAGPRVAVVSFQDEEGRFGGIAGSAVWSGQMSLAEADAQTDDTGLTFGSARSGAAQIGPLGAVMPQCFSAYIEPHIEQGPVLDTQTQSIGVVDTIVGVRSWTLSFTGEANHAGTTPMRLRRDAVQGVARYIVELNATFAPLITERSVWTVGRIIVSPNAASIVPGAATVSVQMRDPQTPRLEAMHRGALDLARKVAKEYGLELTATAGLALDPVPMAPELVALLAQAAEATVPGGWRQMPSGALHDASNVAAVLPAAMVFVPSIGGISHNPNEDTAEHDLIAGLQVMAWAIAKYRA